MYNCLMNSIYISAIGDGRYNLAIDEYLLDLWRSSNRSGIMLYFYVNANAVIIGRNQNAWKECNIAAMDADGVQLVRRHTGGGAVYHDRGNLNFSFIANEREYDVQRQTNVIINAVRRFGVEAEASGRNDILASGRKFSGNAFGLSGTARSQHGTVLVNTDMTRLDNYLNVSAKKMRSKGVESVRARVCNLSELCADVTVDAIRDAVIESFAAEYGDCEGFVIDDGAKAVIDELYKKHNSWEWLFGRSPEFDYQIDERLSFGEIQLLFRLKNGCVKDCKVYTDSLNTAIASEIESRLNGVSFDGKLLARQLEGGGSEAEELADYLRTREL